MEDVRHASKILCVGLVLKNSSISFSFLSHVQCSSVSHFQRLSRQNSSHARVLADVFLLQIVPPTSRDFIFDITEARRKSVSKNSYCF